MSKKVDKYIDFNQFPHNKRGHISWKDSVGTIADFFYCGERHIMKIINYGYPDAMHITIKIDDMKPETVYIDKVRKLFFDHLFISPNYAYNVGDIVNQLIILEQCFKKSRDNNSISGVANRVAYKVRCLKDGYEYIVFECDLKNGHGCPVCSGNIVVMGINDLATTDPNIIEYLYDKNDAYRYSRGSGKYICVKCIHCGYIKQIKVNDLTKLGYFGCPKCNDGLSYCNKFAHELFAQLKEQYLYYDIENSPDWAGKLKYDNYLELLNGTRIFVEMDGHLHYRNDEKYKSKYDKLKNKLAIEHNIKIIRVDCNYPDSLSRYKYVKENMIKAISNFFDLSNVDWNKCNESGLSNKLIDVVEYYNRNVHMSISQIARIFGYGVTTVRNYIEIGNDLGLCDYIKFDHKRNVRTIHLAVYDLNKNFIGAFFSAKEFAEKFANEGIKRSSVNAHSRTGKQYKGYIIKPITQEEYELFQKNEVV